MENTIQTNENFEVLKEDIASIEFVGLQGDKGETYNLTKKDKQDIAKSIKVPIVEKVVEKIIVEKPIVTNEIKEVALKDTPSEIKDKLETLTKDLRLDASAIKGLDKFAEKRAIDILDQRTQFLINKRSSTGGGTWGTITGNITDQTDLQTALNAKYDASNPDGYITSSSLLWQDLGGTVDLITPADIDLQAYRIKNTERYLTTNSNVILGTQYNYQDGVTPSDVTIVGSNIAQSSTDASLASAVMVGTHIGEYSQVLQSVLIGDTILQYTGGSPQNSYQDVMIGSNIGPTNFDYASNTNVFIGYSIATSGYAQVYGNNNIAIGGGVMTQLTTAQDNLSIGTGSSALLRDGAGNLALGAYALYSNQDNGFNLAIGAGALQNQDGVDGSFAIGGNALTHNTTGTGNMAIGTNAMYQNLSSNDNMMIGTNAGYNIVSGSGANTGIGNGACQGAVGATPEGNLGIGTAALYGITTASGNVGIGASAGSGITSGGTNTLIGNSSGYTMTGATGNTFVGYNTGGIATGDYNTLIGHQAGNSGTNAITTGANNIIIGASNSVASKTASNQLTIGNFIYGTGLDGTNDTISAGFIGIGVKAPTARLHLMSGAAAANKAPLKFTAGTNLTTPELGAMEFTDNGTTSHLYITVNIAGVLTRVQII